MPAEEKRTTGTWAGISTVLGTLVAVLGIIGISITFSAVDKFGKDLQNIGGHDPAAMSDVAVSGCSVTSEYGFTSIHATVKIANSTAKTQSYMSTIGVNGADGCADR
jgi:hypothetical protein